MEAILYNRGKYEYVSDDQGTRPTVATFEYTDYKTKDLDYEIDPDNNFFSSIINNCCYYTDQQYNQSISSEGKLSIIHLQQKHVCKL